MQRRWWRVSAWRRRFSASILRRKLSSQPRITRRASYFGSLMLARLSSARFRRRRARAAIRAGCPSYPRSRISSRCATALAWPLSSPTTAPQSSTGWTFGSPRGHPSPTPFTISPSCMPFASDVCLTRSSTCSQKTSLIWGGKPNSRYLFSRRLQGPVFSFNFECWGKISLTRCRFGNKVQRIRAIFS